MKMTNVKTRLSKALALLAAVLLLLAAFPACASYDRDYAIYELWVAGVKVTTRNQDDILGDGTVSYVGNGKTGTLTLNGADLSESANDIWEALIVSTIEELTVELVGENKIGMGEKPPVNGISAFDLEITGEGSLSVGARASCIKASTLTVESGKIDTYIKTAEDEIASFIGVGLWAQELLTVNGGEIEVHYAPEYTALSYGLYCVQDLVVNGGTVSIREENAAALAIGVISSEKLTVAGGTLQVYGNDDAMNAKYFEMTGGTVRASAVDLFLAGFDPTTGDFVFGSDGVCRLVLGAEFSGGSFALAALERMDRAVPTLYSINLVLEGMRVSGGEGEDSLAEKDISTYAYTDTYIRIEKEEG